MEDFEIEYDATCPECGHSPLHSRECTNWCEDGFIDESEDDPINFMPGESERRCPECKGTGVERWCPSCGENLSGVKVFQDDNDEEQ
jgi:DnaJ-class molecular chaperone